MYLKIKLHPGSKDEEIKRLTEDRLEIWVKDKAENNLVNQRMLEIVRGYLKIKGEIRIVHGHHTPNKIVLVGDR